MHAPQTEVFVRGADGAELLRVVLDPGEYVLGRDATCAVCVDAEAVSREHARLTITAEHALIEDLGSSNGTKVNGTRVEGSVRLWPNQRIQLGSATIELHRVKTLAPDVSLSPSTATMRELLPEEIFREKKYEIGGVVAQGGMGAILNAREAAIERTVAMKVMLDGSSPDELVRFVAEAKVTGQLEHPNIVPVHELGVDENDQVFYTMKFVRGITLRKVLELMASGEAPALAKYPLGTLLTVFQKVCDAVAFAHSKGVIHRDLKPENIMLGDYGEVLVMDWGLAKVLAPERSRTRESLAGSDAVSRPNSDEFGYIRALPIGTATMTGSIMGTPQYMAPEQARGEVETLDERADIYALGAILYHILALRPSVVGSDAYAIVERVARGAIDPLGSLSPSASSSSSASRADGAGKEKKMKSGGRIPDSVAAVVRKAMALSPAQRYASVAELQADITAFQNGFATSAEKAGAWKQLSLLIARHKREVAVGAAALLALVGFGVWFIVNLRASERVAKQNEQLAKENEQRALAQEEETRRTLARAQTSVAEAAFRSGDRTAMVEALEAVPGDLRDQLWGYLSLKRNASLGPFRILDAKEVSAVAAVPGQPDCFGIAYRIGAIQIVNVRTGENLLGLKTAFSGDIALGFSPDGSRFAVTAKGAADIRILRTGKGGRIQVLPAPSKRIDQLVFSPDGTLLAAVDALGGKDAKLSLIDLASGAVRWQQDSRYMAVHFSPDGTRLFVTAHGALRTFRTLDVATGKIVGEVDANTFSSAMSLDGKLLALGLQSGEVAIVDTATGAELRRARLHQGEVTHMAWTKHGHLLTLGSEGGLNNTARGRRVLRLWDATTFALRGTFFGMSQLPNAPDWDYQAASGYLLTRESPPQLWHIPVDAEAARIVSVAEQGRSVHFISDTLLLARRNHELALYDVSDPQRPRALPRVMGDGESMSAVSWSAGLAAVGKHTGRTPFSIKLLGSGSDLPLKREMSVAAHVSWLAFDAPGARLLATLRNNTVQIFATDTGAELLKMPHAINRAVFSANGERFIGIVPTQASADQNVDILKIFDAKTGEVLKKVVHRMRLVDLVASPDRRLIAVSGEEPIVRVLDADTLEERFAFRAHDDDITALAFHPTAPILASASNDGTVKLWDYESANLRQTFHGIDGTPVMLAFSPNGRLLALESQEHVVRIFDLGTQSAPAAKNPAKPEIAPDAQGWLDLLGALKADEVNETGNGWTLENGALRSPAIEYAALPLPVDPPSGSYQLRFTVQQAEPTGRFAMLFPVGGRDTIFLIDEWPPNYASGIGFNVRNNATRADNIKGRQINDLAKHEIELTVRVTGQQAKIEVQLDGKPFFQWAGVVTEISRSPFWRRAPTGIIGLGTNAPHWVVSAAKLKRL